MSAKTLLRYWLWLCLLPGLLLAGLASAATVSLTLSSYPAQPVTGQVLTYRATWVAGTGPPCFGDLIVSLPASGATFLDSNPGGSFESANNRVRWSNIRFHNNTGDRWVRVLVTAAGGSLPAASARVTGGCSTSTGPQAGPVVNPGAQPHLTLDKTASRTTAGAGEQISYTLTYANNGSGDATGVVLTDTLPADVLFYSASGGGAHAAGTVTWNIGTIPAGASGAVSATVTVASPIANGTVLANTAELASNELAAVNAGPVNVTATSAPVLSVLKQAPGPQVAAGQVFTYLIDYANSGTDTATGVVVTDTLPSGLAFVSATGGGSHSNGVVTWNLPDLGAGAAHQLSLTAKVASPISDGSVLGNAISITSAQTGIVAGPTVDVTASSAPVLELQKTVSRATANAGERLVYTLTYSNTGSDTATGVQLQDVLPPDTLYVSDTGGGAVSGQQVTWNLGKLRAGEGGSIQLQADIVTPIADGTVLHNTASLLSAQVSQPTTAFADTRVSSAPVLSVEKQVSRNRVQDGDSFVYTITYANTGTDAATNVVLEDALPADTVFVSATGGGVYAAPTNSVSWSLGTLAAGARDSVTVTLRTAVPLADGTVLVNSASIDADQTSPVSAASEPSRVTVSSAPLLLVDLTPSQTRTTPGSTLVYTLDFANFGTDAGSGTQLEFLAAPGTRITGAGAGGVVSGDVVNWSFGNFPAGALGSVTVTVEVDSPLANGTRLSPLAGIAATGGHLDLASTTTVVDSAPLLSLSKRASRTQVQPGDSLVYTLAFDNSGTDAAGDVVLRDFLPAGVSFVSASAGGTESGGVVTWNLGDLAAPAAGSVTLTVRVNSPLPDGTLLENLASIESTATSPVSASHRISVSSQPDLSIRKSVSSSTVVPGNTLVYTLEYANNGTDQATGVVLEDHLPDNVTFVRASGGGSESSPGIVQWSIGTLAAGARSSVTVEVTVDSPLANGTVLHNVATIDGDQGGPRSSPVVDVRVSSAPLLQLAKTGPAVVSAGSQATYTLSYSNTGHDTATGLVLRDTLPANTTLVSSSPSGKPKGGSVTWNLPDLPAGGSGAILLTLAVDSPLPSGTRLVNQASLSSAELLPVTATARTDVSSAPILRLDKRATRDFVAAGEQLTYTLDYSNQGNSNAAGVVLVDHLPPEVSFVSATGGGSPSGADVTWNIGSLPAGSSGSVSVTVQVDSPISSGIVIPNAASISATGVPPLAAPLVPVLVLSAPQFTLDKQASASVVDAGGTVSFEIDYFNGGTDTATGVVLTDQVPANTSFVSASAGGSEAGGVVSWNLGSVPALSGGKVTVTLQIDEPLANGTVISNQAELTSNETAALTGGTGFVVSSAPQLALAKQSQPGAVVQAGQDVTYTLRLENNGSDSADHIAVVDDLPAGASAVSIGQGGSFDAATSRVSWNIPALAAGASLVFDYTLRVPTGLANGSSWTNRAAASARNAAPASASRTLTIASQARLELRKSGGNSVNAGENLTYTLEYANTGNAVASNAILRDTLPAGLLFVAASDAGAHNAGVVTWALGDLAPGASGSVELTLQAPLGALDGTLYANTAELAAANAQAVVAHAQSSVRSHVELDVAISAGPSPVAPGDAVVYTITYHNAGNEDASNATLRASLPANAVFASANNSGAPSGGDVLWNLGTLAAGDSGSVSFTVDANTPLPDGTALPSTATLAADLGLPDSASTAVAVASSPLVVVVKAADLAEAEVGDIITFGIGLANFGNAVAGGVSVIDALPPELALLSVDAGGIVDQDANTVTWDLGDLAPDGSIVILSVRAQVIAPTDAIVNTATIDYAQLVSPFSFSTGVAAAGATAVPVPALPLAWLWLSLIFVLGAAARVYYRGS
ncbi:COG1361 S-layer family protein [Mangrovimicrobium sediminis]|nr:DUF11 domain-containing protein [Haliea sp. SAOS-164]